MHDRSVKDEIVGRQRDGRESATERGALTELLNADRATFERVALRLYRGGRTSTQVAQILQDCGASCTLHDVEDVILTHGVPSRAAAREANTSLAQRKREELKLLAERFLGGEPMRDIAEEVGVHQNRLAQSLKEEGLLPDMNLQKLRKLQRRKIWNGEGREP